MAENRFARVATDLSHAFFFDSRFKAWIPESDHQCILYISSVYPIAPVVVDALSFNTPVSGSLCIVVALSETQGMPVQPWFAVSVRGAADRPAEYGPRVAIQCHWQDCPQSLADHSRYSAEQ